MTTNLSYNIINSMAFSILKRKSFIQYKIN